MFSCEIELAKFILILHLRLGVVHKLHFVFFQHLLPCVDIFYDINAEKVIINLIKEKFPNHNIIAEENESQNNASDYTWIIDPIDGTRSYIIGRPLWGTLIGLAFKGMPIIGLADFPALDERWLGYGKRCYLNKNDFESRVSIHNNLSQATVASTSPSLFSDLGKKKYKEILLNTKSHIWSGDCHNYILLINGNLDLTDDDSDDDTFYDFIDSDDDNDGTLTIDEDLEPDSDL